MSGPLRVCDSSCHEAKFDDCNCWCGGLFHGSKGEAAREAFADIFGDYPSYEFGLPAFHMAMAAAKAASEDTGSEEHGS
jgi:hypothetical protein